MDGMSPEEMAELVNGYMHGSERQNPWTPTDSAPDMIEELEDTFIDYKRACRFEPGDIVHPKEGADLRGRGRPHRVYETYKTQYSPSTQRDGHCYFHDMIVVVVLDGELQGFRAHSTWYEIYKGVPNE